MTIQVANHGHASTSNATLQYLDSNGQIKWTSSAFTVNATNTTMVALDTGGLDTSEDGSWQMYYQVRVINASRWVAEEIDVQTITLVAEDEASFLTGFGLFNSLTTIISIIGLAVVMKPEDEDLVNNCLAEIQEN